LLVIRDSPDVIRLAEHLIQSQYVAEPELMLEMEVLEVNRTKALELGVEFPSSLSVIGTQTLKTIKSLSSADWQLDGGPNLHFKKTDTLANVLANPRIRVKNREKAHVHVGSRKPIFTTNITPQGGQNQTVQYIDDGLKLEVEPVINVDDDVTIRVALDYSTSSPTGTAYTINTRNATTQLRLRDGETQVLAGLIKDSDTDTQAKVPGLGDIPGIGRLFSYNKPSRDKTDLILAITPHVIRNLPPQSAARAEVFIGTESSMGRVPTTIRDGMVLPPTLAPFMTMPAKKPADNPAPAAPAGGSNAPAGNNGQTQGSGNAGNGGTQGQDSNSGFGLGLPKSLTFPGGQPQ
jgi:general secretion pathway protein D